MTTPVTTLSAPLAILSGRSSLAYALPEIALAVSSLLVVAWNLWAPGTGEKNQRTRKVGALAITLLALGVSALVNGAELVGARRLPLPASLFDGQLACDGYACAFRLFFALVTAFVVVAAIPTEGGAFAPRASRARAAGGGELFALLLLACLGMNLLAMGRTLLAFYLAIELLSVASIGLVGRGLGAGDTRVRSEAALKLVISSGVASGVMLYGMSWLYGATQAIALPEIAERAAALTHEQGHLPNAIAVGVACVVAGFAYKIAAAPFHVWAPDVFEGSPALVAAFLAVGGQAAGLAALLRFFDEGFAVQLSAPEAQAPWPVLAGALAVATMTIGNLGALGQRSLKRLLAYASVAQVGTILLAFSAPRDEGIAALLFSLLPYAAVTLGAFVVVLALGEALADDKAAGDSAVATDPAGPTIDALRGLGARAPGMAAALTLFLVSLVGLPPFAGFAGKLYVLTALLRGAGDYHSWHYFLAVVALGNTALSLAYSARILHAMYMVAPPPGEGGRVSVRRLHAVMTAIAIVPTVFLGVWWGPLYDFLTRTVTMIP